MELAEALKQILMGRKANTQEDLCHALAKQGYEINQSTVSRLLRKIGAIKMVNSQGRVVYSLPREPAPPTIMTPLHQLVLDISANETMIVIITSPGSASMIGRVLDYHQEDFGILGTLAGDDCVFVVPTSVKHTQKLLEQIRLLFHP